MLVLLKFLTIYCVCSEKRWLAVKLLLEGDVASD
jgi:hypothetical protein